MIIKNGLIHDAVNREPYIGDIRIVDGIVILEAFCLDQLVYLA